VIQGVEGGREGERLQIRGEELREGIGRGASHSMYYLSFLQL
jgi:hypothetical protein